MSNSPIQHEPDSDIGLELDLDSERAARAEMKKPATVRIAGRALELPSELPLDVLDPLTHLNVDVSVLVRQVMDARKAGGDQAQETVADAVVDMLVVNPSLPTEIVEAVKEMTRRLFGIDGYEHLTAQRLSVGDVAALGKFVMRRYGVGLGEASRSSDSSTSDGTTSKATSRGATETSATSGGRRRTRAS